MRENDLKISALQASTTMQNTAVCIYTSSNNDRTFDLAS